MLVLVFIFKQIVVKLPFIQVNWRKQAPRGSMIVLGNKALPSLIHKRLIMTDITSWLTHLTLITTDIITELIILFPLQVGCVCSQERRGEDAFSIFYPRCSAEISWQMAEDRLTGMCMWRKSHVKNDCFFIFKELCGTLWVHSHMTGGEVKTCKIWQKLSSSLQLNLFLLLS